MHGNLLHAPDHALLTDTGPVAINWKASGQGPRLAELAYLIWGTGAWHPRRPDPERIEAVAGAYRQHVEPTDEELDRLEEVMYLRTLYLTCFGYRRAVAAAVPFKEWGFIRPREYFQKTAAAAATPFDERSARDARDVLTRVRDHCMALPEVTVRVDEPRIRARSTAWSFDIRRRSFCLLVAVRARDHTPAPRLVLRADPHDRDALASFGHPYFVPQAGALHRDRLGVRLTANTDWAEVGQLILESYRLLAPKKLTARLE